jgi:chalcone isomerase
MILPLTGHQYSEKVSENCVAFWKSVGIYTDAEAKAIEKFLEVFKDENFPPGSSILFTQSPNGSLTVSKSLCRKLIGSFISHFNSQQDTL